MNRKALYKIVKCLRLSKSDNPHEAAAALRQAQALMEKHGIDESDVALAEFSEQRETFARSSGPPDWMVRLANLIDSAFGVYSFIDGRVFVFVGKAPRDVIAGYAFTVLRRQLTRARTNYYKSLRGKKANKIRKADLFAQGWVLKVSRTVREFAGIDEAESEALNTYLKRCYPGLTVSEFRGAKISRKDAEHLLRGIIAAKDVRLDHGVAASDEPRRLTRA